MSKEVLGVDYEQLKRHYLCDDSVTLIDPTTGIVVLNGIPFTDVEDYYVVGTLAYMNDPGVVNPTTSPGAANWCQFTHGQAAAPIFLQPILAAVNIAWPAKVPAFESKDMLVRSDQNCWIRFEGPNRTRHFIPANQYLRFHRRFFMFWVQRAGGNNGTLRVYIEG
jgi:hypothetical protein